MNEKLLTALLTLITQLLPEEERHEHLRDWLADCQAERHPLYEAVKMVHPAWKMRAPFQVTGTHTAQVARLDRLGLALGKYVVGMAWLLIITLASALLFTGGATLDLLQYLAGASMFAVFGTWLCWKGLDRDVPWLRATRAGSAVMLSTVLLPIFIVTLIPGTNLTANQLVMLLIFTVMTWDAYWGVHRPLKKRGILGRK